MTDRQPHGYEPADPPSNDGAASSGAAVKGVLVRVPAGLHRDLKMLAVHRDTSIQALMLGAIRDMIDRINPPR